MLKRSLLTLLVAGLAATGAFAQGVVSVNTGHASGANILDMGVPTTVTLGLHNSGGSTLGIGGVILDWSAPDNLTYDPASVQWLGLLGNAATYFFSVVPPQTVLLGDPSTAQMVPAGGNFNFATLSVTGIQGNNPPIPASLNLGSGAQEAQILNSGFEPIPLTGTTLAFGVVPEPATIGLLVLGALASLRRVVR